MTSGHFSLSEYGIARSNSDIGSEKKLVARALTLALNRDNKRLLATRRYRADWIDEVGSFREAALCDFPLRDWTEALEDPCND